MSCDTSEDMAVASSSEENYGTREGTFPFWYLSEKKSKRYNRIEIKTKKKKKKKKKNRHFLSNI